MLRAGKYSTDGMQLPGELAPRMLSENGRIIAWCAGQHEWRTSLMQSRQDGRADGLIGRALIVNVRSLTGKARKAGFLPQSALLIEEEAKFVKPKLRKKVSN